MSFVKEIEERIAHQLAKNRICIPGIITKVYDDLSVDVKAKDTTMLPLGHVPVMTIKYGDTYILSRPKVDDQVLILMSQYDIRTMIERKETYTLQNPTYAPRGAVVLCGFFERVEGVEFPEEGVINIKGNVSMSPNRWFQPPLLDHTEEGMMVVGWGIAEEGRFWFNTTQHRFRGWNGTVLVDLS